MDQNAPPELTDTPESAYQDCKKALSFEPVGFHSNSWSFLVPLYLLPLYMLCQQSSHSIQKECRFLGVPTGNKFILTWVDQRSDIFPDLVPSNVTKVVPDDPIFEVREQAPQSYYLVMTHILTMTPGIGCRFRSDKSYLDRADSLYLGVIGSKSKRKRFHMRLSQRGYSKPTNPFSYLPDWHK